MNERDGRDYNPDDENGLRREDWSQRRSGAERGQRNFSRSEAREPGRHDGGRNYEQQRPGYGPGEQSGRYRQSDQYGQGGASYGAGADRYGYGRDQYGSAASGYGHGWQGGENVGDRWVDERGLERPGYGSSSRSQGSGGGYGEDRSYGAERQGRFAGKGPKGYTRSDERIREDVCDRLSADDELDASDITVTVKEGEVSLEGTVPDRRSKHRAEDIADAVGGVKEVHNSLRAQKGFLAEVGDRISGKDTDQHGHSGSGTRNSPGSSGMHGAPAAR